MISCHYYMDFTRTVNESTKTSITKEMDLTEVREWDTLGFVSKKSRGKGRIEKGLRETGTVVTKERGKKRGNCNKGKTKERLRGTQHFHKHVRQREVIRDANKARH